MEPPYLCFIFALYLCSLLLLLLSPHLHIQLSGAEAEEYCLGVPEWYVRKQTDALFHLSGML